MAKYLDINTNGNFKSIPTTVTGGTASDAGKLIELDANGKIDESVLPSPTGGGSLIGFPSGCEVYTFGMKRNSGTDPWEFVNLPAGWTVTTTGAMLTVNHNTNKFALLVTMINLDTFPPDTGDLLTYVCDANAHNVTFRLLNKHDGTDYNIFELQAGVGNNKYQFFVVLVPNLFHE